MLSLDEARAQILAAVTAVSATEPVPLGAALSRVLAADVIAPFDIPRFDNSAMDGYALRCGDELPVGGRYPIAGIALAGVPFSGQAMAGQAIRIMTGAPLPSGADTVIRQEDVDRVGEAIQILKAPRPGANIRRKGEDVRQGEVAVPAGRRLRPSDIGTIASLGIGQVEVRRRVRVACFSTGDEICAVGDTPHGGQIFDANGHALRCLLMQMGADVIDLGIVRDAREPLAQAMRTASTAADVVVTSGGVSVGDADFVKEVLSTLGEIAFWKLAIKPGKPLAFGKIGQALYFGLPGNPVSAMVTFQQVVRPAIDRLSGGEIRMPVRIEAVCTSTLKGDPVRTDFQRGFYHSTGQGAPLVQSVGEQGSHLLSSVSRANCFIVLPPGAHAMPGTTVLVEPFDVPL